MNKTIQITSITLLTFAVYFFLDNLFFKILRNWINETVHQIGISHILTYLLSGVPLLIGAIAMHRWSGSLKSLGLDKSIGKGILFSLVCTLPMLVGYAIVSDFNYNITTDGILISVVAAGFFEELFFRGFLFGQLYRFSKLGFFPSVLIGALLFASLHLNQSNDVGTLVGIFLVTFLGALLFAWAYAEWSFNIWIPVFLHFFMNLFFELFSVGENALGGIYMNIFRLMVILLIISITVIYKRKKGIKLEIIKATLWMKK
ncbi:MAG: CPBP family intramembrane glutamic endopeptidase [Flavobacteriaceae bacterium]|nr:CPBP family intramembrane glutamic endopeptidase [Flavobacteriaceae bacterium]